MTKIGDREYSIKYHVIENLLTIGAIVGSTDLKAFGAVVNCGRRETNEVK